MKITKIVIKNYRSVKLADFSPEDFNTFVGQNNHGKTNIFEAIDWFFNKSPRGTSLDDIAHAKKDKPIEVELTFNGLQEAITQMKNQPKQTTLKKQLGDTESITIKRSSEDEKKRQILVGGDWKDHGTGFDNALNDLLPAFEYIDTRKYFDDVGSFGKKTPVGVMLSGVLQSLLETSDEYKKFQQEFESLFGSDSSDIKIELDKLSNKVKIYLEKQFPDCTRVTFEVLPPQFEDLLKNFETTVDDGVETRAQEKGDGMQRALMLSILQAYAEYRKQNTDVGKSFLFFIDEAELHLHPTAQRNLKDVLSELSKQSDQIFINTHSSVFIADDDDNKIFQVEKLSGKTQIKPIAKKDKKHIIYELLGGKPNDLLLPRNFLIVEGRAEYEFARIIIDKFYQDKPEIQVIFAEGDIKRQKKSMDAINKVYAVLREGGIYKDKLSILCDKPKNQDDFKKFNRCYPELQAETQLYILDTHSIEEYYPGSWKKTKDETKVIHDNLTQIELAKKVAKNISKQEFENEMSIFFQALQKAWKEAF